jgi:uncharacterized protein (DUF2336 family)
MALSAQDMSSMGRLAHLAANPQGVGRDEIYVAVASLFRAQGARLSEHERDLMREILQRLSRDVEMAVRIALAERLADDEDAPLDLILMLCDDKIEVARPVILRSKKLTDGEILRFVADATIAHQTAIAERKNIGGPVCDMLARSEVESVLLALVRNATAQIGETAFSSLVEKSKKLDSLHAPLAYRSDLPMELGKRMSGWVSDALKAHIAANYDVKPEKLSPEIQNAQIAVQTASPTNAGDGGDNAKKLVEKLASAGQLKAGFLLRVLHQGQTELFELAFARLVDLDLPRFRNIFYEQGPRSVALACRAVGIDKCVFATVFNLSRQTRGVRPTLTNEQRAEVENVFNAFSKTDAGSILRAA